jgi:hypothetical protein
MNQINWGVVFGVCSLLLLQIGFAVGAILLFFAGKAQLERAKDVYNNHLRETDALKRQNDTLGKKIDGYKQKLEEFREVKIDGWEEADKDILSKVRSNGARISQLHKLIKDNFENMGDELPEYSQNVGPAPTHYNNEATPAGGGSSDFGKVVI